MSYLFISYRHENVKHAGNVRSLAEKLKQSGISVMLDQFFLEEHPGGPDSGWAKWCADHAERSACVLAICSKGWFNAAEGKMNAGMGSAWEARILSQDIYQGK